MAGIDMKRQIEYCYASFRYFDEGERHVTRFCNFDVLLMVFDGILRFTEDGVEYSVGAGEYHIQRKGSFQSATSESASPRYLYVHFFAEWGDGIGFLPKKGHFNISSLMPLMEKMHDVSHAEYSYIEQSAVFYSIISSLYRNNESTSLAETVFDLITENYKRGISLDELSKKLFFSKNHIIGRFRKTYGCTPLEYMNSLRLAHAEKLLLATTDTACDIAAACGFADYTCFFKLFKKKHGASPTEWRCSVQTENHEV